MGRRLAGFFAALLMANATLVNAAACVPAPAAPQVPAMHHIHVHGNGGTNIDGHGGAPAPDHAPCDNPSDRGCCTAAMPCNLSLGVPSGAVTIAVRARSGTGVAGASPAAPADRFTSPDPPPPKA